MRTRRPLIGLTTYRERAVTGVWDTELALLPQRLRRRSGAGGRGPGAAAAAGTRRRRGDRGRRRPGAHRRVGRRPGALPAAPAPGDRRPPVARRLGTAPARRARWRPTCRCSASAGARSCSTWRSAARSTSTCPTSVGHRRHGPAPGVFGQTRVTVSPGTVLHGLLGAAVDRRLPPPPGHRQAGAGARGGRAGPTTASSRRSSCPVTASSSACSGTPSRTAATCGCSRRWWRRPLPGSQHRTKEQEQAVSAHDVINPATEEVVAAGPAGRRRPGRRRDRSAPRLPSDSWRDGRPGRPRAAAAAVRRGGRRRPGEPGPTRGGQLRPHDRQRPLGGGQRPRRAQLLRRRA